MNQALRSAPSNFGRRSLPLLCAALAILMVVAMVVVNRGLLAAEIYETGDAAANSLLVDDARHLRLLTGNYSRIGFHHPGPAILYALAAGEALFHDFLGWTGSPVAGQMIAGYVYNAAWSALLLWLFATMLGSSALALAAVALFLAFTGLQDPQYLVGIWFPYLYYFPFAVFTVAVARLAAGRLDALWALCLSAGFLVHGHASFIAIVGIMLAGGAGACAVAVADEAGAAGWRAYLRREARRHRRQLLVCAAIALAFAFPVALNTAVDFPGEIPKYVAYRGAFAGNGWRDSLEFVAYFWGGRGIVALAVGLLALALLWRDRRAGPGDAATALRDTRGAVASIVLATAALAFYAKTGIDFLAMKYTGYFYFAAVNLALVFGAVTLLRGAGTVPRAARVATTVVAAVVAFATLQQTDAEFNADVPKILAALREMPRQPVALDLEQGAEWQRLWSTVAGVASHATRRGERVICVNRNWHVLFTARLRCSDEDLRTGTRLFVTARAIERQPDDGVIDLGGLRFLRHGLVRVADETPLMFVDANAVVAARVLGPGWSAPERDFTWSTGPLSSLEFQVERPGALRLVLDVAAFLPGPESTQQVELRVNGRELGQIGFSPARNRAERAVSVPADLVPADGRIVLELRVRSPVSPASAGASPDTRPLGVALRSVRVDRTGER